MELYFPRNLSQKLGQSCFWLLQLAALLRAVLAIAFLSVRLSVTRQYYVESNKHKMMPFSVADTTMYLVFGDIRHINIFARVVPSEDVN